MAAAGPRFAPGDPRAPRPLVRRQARVPWLLSDDAITLGLRIGGSITKVMAWVLVAVAISGISYEVYLYFTLFSLVWVELFSIWWWLLTLFGVWLLVMIVFNYVLTVITHPGVAPNPAPTALRERVRLQMPPPLAIQGDEDHLPPREGGEFSAVHERTGRWKPPRAHFDALSGEIVLKFDHYCPWVANAIGWGNQKYFVGFLVWMMAGCAFAAALALPGFLGAGQFQPEALELPAEAARLPHRPLKHFSAHAAFAFVLPASIGTAMVLFGSWHVFLLFTNQTTIEFFHNIKRRKRALMLGFSTSNFYDLGWRRNAQQVCGTGSLLWLMVPVAFPPEGNGMEWPTNFERGDGAKTGGGAVAPSTRADLVADAAEAGSATTMASSPLPPGPLAAGAGNRDRVPLAQVDSRRALESARRRGAGVTATGLPPPMRV